MQVRLMHDSWIEGQWKSKEQFETPWNEKCGKKSRLTNFKEIATKKKGKYDTGS